MDIQTRTLNGELKVFNSIGEALAYAKTDLDVWKISFPISTGERVRLVKYKGSNVFVLEQLMVPLLEEFE